MVNHARTLLINRPASDNVAPGYYMREWIDPEFTPVVVPQSLRTVHDILFDSNPDELMLNYRARQLMKCLHAGALSGYVTKLDTRVTYYYDHFSFFKPFFMWTPYRHGNTAVKTTDFSIVGNYASPIGSRLHNRWSVHFDSSSSYAATNSFTGNYTTANVAYEQGRSAPLALPGTSLQITVSELPETVDSSNKAIVQLDVVTEPKTTLSDILIRLQQVPGEVLNELFAGAESEPWATFRNCFQTHYNPIMRLSAAVIAYIYRLEQLR